MSLRLARKLDGNLAVKDGLSVELRNGALSLGRSREVNKGVTDGTRGAGVDRDRDGFAVREVSARHGESKEWLALTQGTP